MPIDPRTPFDTWQSRAPAPPPTDGPTVAFLPSHEGDGYAVRFGPFTGPLRATKHAADADLDALLAAVGPALAIADRARQLRASPADRDAVMRAPGSPTSAVLAVLRYVCEGEGAAAPAPDEGQLQWGDAPTLDRVGEMAVVAGEEGE